jgi:hypothetical protein
LSPSQIRAATTWACCIDSPLGLIISKLYRLARGFSTIRREGMEKIEKKVLTNSFAAYMILRRLVMANRFNQDMS